MLDHEIWLPSLSEQQRIVAEIEKQFTRLDAAVAAVNRGRRNLRRYRAAVLASACTNDPAEALRRSHLVTDSPWDRIHLGAVIADIQNGLYLPGDRYGEGQPILRIDDFQNDSLRSFENLRKVRADDSDIVKYTLRPANW